MTDHVHDLASVREATSRLLSAAASLDDAALAAPSRLPGWTRGHILAHLARNADALVNVLTGRPMYASAEARDADIQRDAPRPLAVQLADLREGAARLQRAADGITDWSRTVVLRNGVTDTAARVPLRRWTEVEIHHVDLDIGYELEDLPGEFTDREIAFLAQRFAGRDDLPAIEIVADDGHAWHTGAARGTALTVTGPAPDLLGWLTGRRAPRALDAGGAPVPTLPPF
ncbi:maleylpyruvate isomerase family mycothiol-dependent enzyme [Streptomyces gamaensis]|uniref:Maleylpyruvate isomerase family mycothiol-dependent enzyme n=1 Tax=Streptomyces gamaensis TaxID=1763542 RepID=A0ABW0Z7K8_9ACTN